MIGHTFAVITGDPIPKGRPRCATRTIKGATRCVAMTPDRTRDAEADLATQFKVQNPGAEPLGVPVAVTLEYTLGKGKRADLDNLIKLTLDALNGVAWTDDSLVRLVVAEIRDDRGGPETVIQVEPL